MKNIGIIAGEGKLPILIGNNLLNKKYKITFFLINGSGNKDNYKDYDACGINIFSIKSILKKLEYKKIEKIIMAGKINRPSLSDFHFDLETIKLVKKLFLENKGDDKLLTTLENYFEKRGYPSFDWTKYCKEIYSNEDYLTKTKPSNKALKNLKKGLKIFNNYGKLDVGQSLIVQNEIILGLEAAEGTDNLIKRCFDYKKKGDKGILIKYNKINQSKKIDIPTIGINTIHLLKKFGYEGVFLKKNKCIILDKIEVKKFADKSKIFISAIR